MSVTERIASIETARLPIEQIRLQMVIFNDADTLGWHRAWMEELKPLP